MATAYKNIGTFCFESAVLYRVLVLRANLSSPWLSHLVSVLRVIARLGSHSCFEMGILNQNDGVLGAKFT